MVHSLINDLGCIQTRSGAAAKMPVLPFIWMWVVCLGCGGGGAGKKAAARGEKFWDTQHKRHAAAANHETGDQTDTQRTGV